MTMGKLTTHVLDTANGRPASGVRIDLSSLAAGGVARLIGSYVTNADGRTDKPLLDETQFMTGNFELAFHIGDYFTATGTQQSKPPFLDVVPVRFAIADLQAHYHVPLLVSPWNYSTYRGS
jgi:5-hydroxyisourate hydrolase